jgi:formylglycine-generating enzyme required for sulfatase activity
MMKNEPYTRYPRPTLWLLRDGDAFVGGEGGDTEPPFQMSVEAFYISKSPVTNEEFEVFRRDFERSPSSPGDLSPAVGVSFHEAAAYCDWYSERTGKHFRLPTEVEWEYACRGDRDTRYFFGSTGAQADTYVWHAENVPEELPEVESLRSNPFGLYEMLGTVWEWTSSLHAPYPVTPGDGREDRDAPGDRVARGGSFRQGVDQMGCSVRLGLAPETIRDDVGFRIVRLL